jgi:hypothetical protein
MTSTVLLILGIGVLGFATWDQYWTTLGEGGGPLTRRVAGWVRQFFLWSYRHWPKSRLLSAGGVATILTTVLIWIGLIWIGWALVFSAQEGQVVDVESGKPADIWQRIYFSGYTISTLGIGDIQPRGAIWRVLVPAASLLGLIQITFSIAYLIPISGAATHKRKVASYISCLGQSADDIILNMWDGESLTSMSDHLQSLTSDLALLEQSHITYPVLHYFHSLKRPEAVGPSLAVLDEALSIIEHGIHKDHTLHTGLFHPARRIISNFLQTLDAAAEKTEADEPPIPTLDRLRENDIPVVDDEAFTDELRGLAERRRLLHALVQADGWSWEVARETNGEDADDDEEEALAHREAL